MATYGMGLFMRQMRREKGITQEQLCKGLCSVSTLSKIERGQYTPPGYLFQTLMERMGNFSGRHYIILLDNEDYEHWKIMESINNALKKSDMALSDKLISKHWNTKGFDEGMGLQFMLNSKMSLAIAKMEQEKLNHEKANNWEASLINYDEWLTMAHKSISITIPDFEESKISDYMLSHEEMRAVMFLAVPLIYNNELEKSVPILLSLKKSMDNYCHDRNEKGMVYPALLCNIAEVMYELKRYDEAISFCELGRQICIECSRSREIPYLMLIRCKSLIEKGDMEEGKSLLIQAYIVSIAVGRYDIADILNNYYNNLFGLKSEINGFFPNTLGKK